MCGIAQRDSLRKPPTSFFSYLELSFIFHILDCKRALSFALTLYTRRFQDNFNDDGAELDFCVFDHKARIQIVSTGNSDTGMDHVLTIDGVKIEQLKMATT